MDSGTHADQVALIGWIKARGRTVTVRQLQQSKHRYRKSAQLARDALQAIQDAHLGHWSEDGKQFTLGKAESTGEKADAPHPPLPIVTRKKLDEEGEPDTANGGTVSAPPSITDKPAEQPAREAETRNQAERRWRLDGIEIDASTLRNRIRDECVARGMTRRQAHDHAWEAALAQFPPTGPAVDIAAPEAPKPEPQPTTGQLRGLGDIPDNWPELPPNAAIQAELLWVQAHRLDVLEETASGATVVHLDRATLPAPSKGALGWLETSIRAYAKYVDVVARSLATVADEAEHVRRERMALDDIDALLAEMHEESD